MWDGRCSLKMCGWRWLKCHRRACSSPHHYTSGLVSPLARGCLPWSAFSLRPRPFLARLAKQAETLFQTRSMRCTDSRRLEVWRQGGLSPRTPGTCWMGSRCFRNQPDVPCKRHTCLGLSPFPIWCRCKSPSIPVAWTWQDLVNIGGHRGSLSDLNQKLNEIEGVQDGVFFLPDDMGTSVTRLIAFVVAPGKSAEYILSALRTVIDPVFLPRPLHLVPHLPRNETGKLTREALLGLMQDLHKKERHGSLSGLSQSVRTIHRWPGIFPAILWSPAW